MRGWEGLVHWRPRPPFFYGWLVLGMSALGALIATSVAGVVFGGIQGLIVADTGWSRSSIGLAAASGVWASGVAAPFVGRLTDRYGPRGLMTLCMVLMGWWLWLLGSGSSLETFFVLAVLARAISQPILIGVVPQTLAVNFFRRKRNLALALTSLFRPMSGAILVQGITVVTALYSWRTAFRGMALLSLLLAVPMWLIIRQRPEIIGLLPDGDTAPEPSAPARSARVQEPTPGSPVRQHDVAQEPAWTAREVLRTRVFWLLAVINLLSVASSSVIGFNMVPYLHEEAHLSMAQAAGALSVSTLCALSSLAWGAVAARWTPRRCLLGALTASAAVVLLLTTVQSLAMAYVFSVLWGIVSNAQVLIYILLAQDFGQASYGSLSGAMRPFEAWGLGVGQSAGALLYDLTGSYRGVLVATLCTYVLTVCLMACARPPAVPQGARVAPG